MDSPSHFGRPVSDESSHHQVLMHIHTEHARRLDDWSTPACDVQVNFAVRRLPGKGRAAIAAKDMHPGEPVCILYHSGASLLVCACD